jgi:hypothetical protein
MKRIFDILFLFIGGIIAMSSGEQFRQYEYDQGRGEIEIKSKRR